MNNRYTAVLATILLSFCDALVDYSINKFNFYKVLLLTSITAFCFHLAWGLTFGIEITLTSIPYIIAKSILGLAGYICFAKSLKYLPIGLIGLIETSNLFITLIIDALLGYISITPIFLLMFGLFIFSIMLFSYDCISGTNVCIKNLKPIGYILILCSVFFYVSMPYWIKVTNNLGANAIAINLGYYILAIPYFAYKYFSQKEHKDCNVKSQWWNNLIFLSISVGIFECSYFIAETFSFINDTPTIVMLIEQVRIFLLFGLSVLFKMDTFTLKKSISLLLGIISVIGIYYQ